MHFPITVYHFFSISCHLYLPGGHYDRNQWNPWAQGRPWIPWASWAQDPSGTHGPHGVCGPMVLGPSLLAADLTKDTSYTGKNAVAYNEYWYLVIYLGFLLPRGHKINNLKEW